VAHDFTRLWDIANGVSALPVIYLWGKAYPHTHTSTYAIIHTGIHTAKLTY